MQRTALIFACATLALALAACSNPNQPDDSGDGGGDDPVAQWNAQALETVKSAGAEYRTWKEMIPGDGWLSQPHTGRWVEAYMNGTALGNFKSGSPYNEGAFFWMEGWQTEVKEKLRNHFVMLKMPAGYDEAYGDWYYAQLDGDMNVVIDGNSQNPEVLEKCIACHAEGAKGTDYVFEP